MATSSTRPRRRRRGARRVAVRGVRVHDVRALHAQEMWRLLDPRGALIAAKDLAHKVVSVKQGAELKTLDKAARGRRQISVCRAGRPHRRLGTARDRTSWRWRRSCRTPPTPGRAARRGPGRGGRAGAARRMLDKTRMDLFMTYERSRVPRGASERAARAARPGAHPGGAYRRASRSRNAEPREEAEPSRAGPSARPGRSVRRRADAPALMRAHVKEAAREVAQMGGAERSAAGAGSRLNAMLGGIAAPRVAGAAKTLASVLRQKRRRGRDARRLRDPPLAPPARRRRAREGEGGGGGGDQTCRRGEARERAERETQSPPNAL